jgi:hypothetical protein
MQKTINKESEICREANESEWRITSSLNMVNDAKPKPTGKAKLAFSRKVNSLEIK